MISQSDDAEGGEHIFICENPECLTEYSISLPEEREEGEEKPDYDYHKTKKTFFGKKKTVGAYECPRCGQNMIWQNDWDRSDITGEPDPVGSDEDVKHLLFVNHIIDMSLRESEKYTPSELTVFILEKRRMKSLLYESILEASEADGSIVTNYMCPHCGADVWITLAKDCEKDAALFSLNGVLPERFRKFANSFIHEDLKDTRRHNAKHGRRDSAPDKL